MLTKRAQPTSSCTCHLHTTLRGTRKTLFIHSSLFITCILDSSSNSPTRPPSKVTPLFLYLSLLYLHLILIHLLTLDHLTERTLLHHQAHNLIQRIRSSHGSVLSVGIICRRNLDDISSDDVDALQSTEDSAELASRPSTCLGGTGSWGDCSSLAL